MISYRVRGSIVCLFSAVALAAQTPPPVAGRGRGPMPPAPKKGVCPLPILPALPEASDTSFYASASVAARNRGTGQI